MALPQARRQRRDVGADPVRDRRRHGAAQDRRGLHRDLPLVRQHHGLQPHQILAAAAAGAMDVGNAGGDRDRSVSASRQAEGGGASEALARPVRPVCPLDGRSVFPARACSGSIAGASAGRGLGNGTDTGTCGPARLWPVLARTGRSMDPAGTPRGGRFGSAAHSISSTAATVTIAAALRRRSPQGHLRRAFSALKFMLNSVKSP